MDAPDLGVSLQTKRTATSHPPRSRESNSEKPATAALDAVPAKGASIIDDEGERY